MKKILFISIVLITACTMLVGCQPKNEPQQPSDPSTPGDTITPPKAAPVAAFMDYSFEVSEQMIEALYVIITYYDKDGKLQTDTMTNKLWNMVVTAPLPAKLGVKVTLGLRPDFDASKYDVFHTSKRYEYIAYCLDAEGKKSGTDQKGGSKVATTLDIPGSQIEKFVEKYSVRESYKETLYKIDEDGNFTYLNVWE